MFKDRTHAGTLLAARLAEEIDGRSDVVILGIPRGGVIVAAQMAKELDLPLDVIVTSKIPAPWNAEYAIGAVDSEGEVTINTHSGYSMEEVMHYAQPIQDKVRARWELFRIGREPIDISGKTIVLADDGIATGLTAFAAVDYLKRHKAGSVMLAVPVIAADAARVIRSGIATLVALEEPEVFYSVSQFYRQFDQVTDDDVMLALRGA